MMAQQHSAIEVERKFHVSADCDVKLTQLGAMFISETEFHDVYYDTNRNALSLNDHWLRRRGQIWELKCPPGNRKQSCSTQYEEYEEETEIVYRIKPFISVESGQSLRDLVDSHTVEPFASYTTKRKNYTYDGAAIVLDQTNFGFNVGEVEVIASSEAGIPEALEKVEDVVQKLGVSSERRLVGKMGMYLYQNSRPLYEKLVAAHRIVMVAEDELEHL